MSLSSMQLVCLPSSPAQLQRRRRDAGPPVPAPRPTDPFERAADELSGVWAAMVGIGANASIAAEGAEIELATLVPDVPRPPPGAPPFGPAPPWTRFDPAAYPFLAGATLETSAPA